MTRLPLLTVFLVFSIVVLAGCPNALASGSPDPPDISGPPAPRGIGSSGTIYYLSVSGSDDNDGLSPATAWRTPERLAGASLQPGDKVLFERGGTFRLPEDSPSGLRLRSGSPAAWILYGAWGSGDRPVLLGSADLSNPDDWTHLGDEVWKTVHPLPADTGQVYLNGSADLGSKKWSIDELSSTGDFFSDADGFLHVRFRSGPRDWTGLEAALTRHIIDQDGLSCAVFEDLHLKYGGAHGFGGSDTRYMVIRNCEFSFIGGGGVLPGMLDESGNPVRYGNAVEFWGNARDHLVEGNEIHDIYDTGLTNQNHGRKVTQANIHYRGNRIRNCGLASFEYWVRPESSVMSGIYFQDNISLNPGHGWGAERPSTNSFHVASFSSSAGMDSVILSGNTFATTIDPGREGAALLLFDSNPPDRKGRIIVEDNLWYSVVTDGPGLWIFGLDSVLESYGSLAELKAATDYGNGSAAADPAAL